MNIVKKEIIIFNKEEREAINLLLKICNEIIGATSDSNLEKLAKETYNNVATLVGYEGDEEEEEDKEWNNLSIGFWKKEESFGEIEL